MKATMNNKRIGLLAFVIAGIVVVVGGMVGLLIVLNRGEITYWQADYPQYPDVSQAVKASDVVVTGIPVGSHEEVEYPGGDTESGTEADNPQKGVKESELHSEDLAVPRTITRIKVTRAIKGSVREGQVIEVAQIGGKLGRSVVREQGVALLQDAADTHEGKQLLLLLSAHPGKAYDAINPQSGMLLVGSKGNVTGINAASVRSLSTESTLDEYYRAAK